MSYRKILEKLFLLEFELLGHCDVLDSLDDGTVKFTGLEKDAIQEVREEAYAKYLMKMVELSVAPTNERI